VIFITPTCNSRQKHDKAAEDARKKVEKTGKMAWQCACLHSRGIPPPPFPPLHTTTTTTQKHTQRDGLIAAARHIGNCRGRIYAFGSTCGLSSVMMVMMMHVSIPMVCHFHELVDIYPTITACLGGEGLQHGSEVVLAQLFPEEAHSCGELLCGDLHVLMCSG
jgi:hypothetical protein